MRPVLNEEERRILEGDSKKFRRDQVGARRDVPLPDLQTVDLVALLEKELSKVRSILSSDTWEQTRSDQRNPRGKRERVHKTRAIFRVSLTSDEGDLALPVSLRGHGRSTESLGSSSERDRGRGLVLRSLSGREIGRHFCRATAGQQ